MIMFPADFDKFINKWWPKSIPEDCTKLKVIKNPDSVQDCLERNSTILCRSCFTYKQLVNKFLKLGRYR